MKIAAYVWCAAWLACLTGPASGQTRPAIGTGGPDPAQTKPAHREISLMEGRGELLEFQNDITRVVISEPKIADAVVVSPREVMVNAKGPGSTTLVIWEGDGGPQRFEIGVRKDNTEWDGFLQKVQDNANGAPVMVSGTAESIILTGSVKSAGESKRLAGLAQTRTKTVVNLLQVPPAPSRARSCCK